eukprot:CAMPEP_0113309230 /NCGR_PEP_ID=MMETSP0010_2-20120614/7361_1 /TAXON_ID=216773 ORGANISM="Corethron hystrix, Strain 308" /NCGR_SAMPLE_ID=MMETSP0010_2 /ASSEMBLY_ACC=CAM_ASM_000155 /LENGTH=192 /DNA_ID=CAMNT_0000164449 /DNA_START=203 /DNA_END=777 /DNA_ORIENTATION=+ /assembly_acc=CAM_ASM_000155
MPDEIRSVVTKPRSRNGVFMLKDRSTDGRQQSSPPHLIVARLHHPFPVRTERNCHQVGADSFRLYFFIQIPGNVSAVPPSVRVHDEVRVEQRPERHGGHPPVRRPQLLPHPPRPVPGGRSVREAHVVPSPRAHGDVVGRRVTSGPAQPLVQPHRQTRRAPVLSVFEHEQRAGAPQGHARDPAAEQVLHGSRL